MIADWFHFNAWWSIFSAYIQLIIHISLSLHFFINTITADYCLSHWLIFHLMYYCYSVAILIRDLLPLKIAFYASISYMI